MKVLRSVLRIVVVAALAVLALLGIAAALLRQPLLGRTAAQAGERADPRALRAHVELLTKLPRHAGDPEGLDAAADYIREQFAATGATVDEQRYEARGRWYRNVMARFGPPGGTLLVVGAHYDAFASGAQPLPGADDNASGTAGLLELARLLASHPPERPVALVAYSTEEPPFFGSAQMGSAVHAELADDVEAMICLEMIGYFSRWQTYDSWLLAAIYPDDGEFIAVTGGWKDRALVRQLKRGMQAAGMRAVSFTGPRSMLDASDQRNYWARGITAAMVTDTAYLRNPNYHTARDTAATLD